jgi:hypothetical protein
MEREQTNLASPEAQIIVDQMKQNYNAEFVESLVSLLEHLTDKEFPKRDNLYTLIKTEPYVAVVLKKDSNASNYPIGIPLIVLTGQRGLMTPDGETGKHIANDIRLATDEELIALGALIKE